MRKISVIIISTGIWWATNICFGRPPLPLYLDAKQPVAKRVASLLKLMTLEEKIAQMCQYVGPEHVRKVEAQMKGKPVKKNDDANALYPGLSIEDVEQMTAQGLIGSFLHVVTAAEANYLQRLAQKSRLKIPLLIGIDAIHGNGMVSGCTVYPSPLSISCSWDTALVRLTAAYTAKEMKATGSQWAFAPNLDITRDPRWGRTGETFGEDPFLVSCMGVATIKGLQENGVAACAKHLIGGSQPVNGLNKAPTDISERTLREIFLPPYIAAVNAGVMSMMPAHNELNGIPCHANAYLMEALMRAQYGFKGFYISDWMDIERIVEMHRTVASAKEAIYASVAAGMDMHMHGPGFMAPLLELVKEGKLPEKRIDESVGRILAVKFSAGLFENPFVEETNAQVFTQVHQAAALTAAERSIVLLKNEGLLPLAPGKYRRILVTGPNANNQAQLGDWSLLQPDENVVTVLEGIQQVAAPHTEIVFKDAGGAQDITDSTIQSVAGEAMNTDLIIVVAGDNALRYNAKKTAGENTDKDDISLPGLQQQFIEALYKTGKPVVAILINDRPLAVPWVQQHIPAVIEAWEPGSAGGLAIANILFGKTNPSGKLTVSLPRNIGQIGNYYNHKPSQYMQDYNRNVTGPLFPFGYGLSYTHFSYSNIQMEKQGIKAGESVKAAINVTNSGSVPGEEIVQLYINGSVSNITKPVKELKAFRRVALKPGETKSISFLLAPEVFKSYDMNMKYRIEPGVFTIMVGSSSDDKDLKATTIDIK